MKRARHYEDELKETLKNPAKAAHYLKVASQDPQKRVFLLALKDVFDAHGMTRSAVLSKVKKL